MLRSDTGKTAREIVDENDWSLVTDKVLLEQICCNVLAKNEKAVCSCMHLYCLFIISSYISLSALTLLVGRQERHLACKTNGCWFVGGDSLTGALHVL